MADAHLHRFKCLPYAEGIAKEVCVVPGCSEFRYAATTWEVEFIDRAQQLNGELGIGEGDQMARLPKVLPSGFTPRPDISNAPDLYHRNLLLSRWHDENRLPIEALFKGVGFPGLKQQTGITEGTAAGLFKRWAKADRKAKARADDTPEPRAGSKTNQRENADAPAFLAWPAFATLPDHMEVHIKWLETTQALALAGKVVLT